ncbi:CHAT domain-containing protein [Candidatus Obscuribacterales bacterium]|nr:CHAT domain-containing protein [Candidatus Obscuribacterales bacterium]
MKKLIIGSVAFSIALNSTYCSFPSMAQTPERENPLTGEYRSAKKILDDGNRSKAKQLFTDLNAKLQSAEKRDYSLETLVLVGLSRSEDDQTIALQHLRGALRAYNQQSNPTQPELLSFIYFLQAEKILSGETKFPKETLYEAVDCARKSIEPWKNVFTNSVALNRLGILVGTKKTNGGNDFYYANQQVIELYVSTVQPIRDALDRMMSKGKSTNADFITCFNPVQQNLTLGQLDKLEKEWVKSLLSVLADYSVSNERKKFLADLTKDITILQLNSNAAVAASDLEKLTNQLYHQDKKSARDYFEQVKSLTRGDQQHFYEALAALVPVSVSKSDWDIPSKELIDCNKRISESTNLSQASKSLLAASTYELYQRPDNFKSALQLTYRALTTEGFQCNSKCLPEVWMLSHWIVSSGTVEEPARLLSIVMNSSDSDGKFVWFVNKARVEFERLESQKNNQATLALRRKFQTDYVGEFMQLVNKEKWTEAAKVGYEGLSFLEKSKLSAPDELRNILLLLAGVEAELEHIDKSMELIQRGKNLGDGDYYKRFEALKSRILARESNSQNAVTAESRFWRIHKTIEIELDRETPDKRKINDLIATAKSIVDERTFDFKMQASSWLWLASWLRRMDRNDEAFECLLNQSKVIEAAPKDTFENEIVTDVFIDVVSTGLQAKKEIPSSIILNLRKIAAAKTTRFETKMQVMLKLSEFYADIKSGADVQSKKQFFEDCFLSCESLCADLSRIDSTKDNEAKSLLLKKLSPNTEYTSDLWNSLLGTATIVAMAQALLSDNDRNVQAASVLIEKLLSHSNHERKVLSYPALVTIYVSAGRLNDAERIARQFVGETEERSDASFDSRTDLNALYDQRFAAKNLLAEVLKEKGDFYQSLDVLNSLLVHSKISHDEKRELEILRKASAIASFLDDDLSREYADRAITLIMRETYKPDRQDAIFLEVERWRCKDEKMKAVYATKQQAIVKALGETDDLKLQEMVEFERVVDIVCNDLMAKGNLYEPSIDLLLKRQENSFSANGSKIGFEKKRLKEHLRFKSRVLLARHEHEGAWPVALRLRDSIVSNLRELEKSGSYRDLYAFANAELPSVYQAFVFCALSPNLTDSAYDQLVGIKGILNDVLKSKNETSSNIGDKEVDQLQQLRSKLAGWAQQKGATPGDVWNDTNSRISGQISTLERAIATASPDRKIYSLTQLKNALRKDEMFVDIYQVPDVATMEPCYFAFIIKPNESVHPIRLGTAKKIDASVSSILGSVNQLSNKVARTLTSDETDECTSAEESVEALRSLELVRAIPSDAKKVWICPDGMMGSVPWQMLLSFDHKNASICNIDSPRRLIQIRNSNFKQSKEDDFLAVGGLKFSEPRLELKGSLEEVDAICKLANSQHVNVQLVTGVDASKTKIKELIRQCTMAHLATHGFFSASPRSAMIADVRRFLESENLNSKEQPNFPSLDLNPMVKSGILLSDDNEDSPSIAIEDRLTAEELIGLDLNKCELLTVSACVSGRGESLSGQGLLGLQSAFLSGGVRCLLVSLWDVPDVATQRLMTEFYKNLWEKKQSKAQALRNAQETLRAAEQSTVKDWAGWLLIGDGF